MKIFKEINAEIIKDKISCYDLDSLKIIFGTDSVTGNYHMYNIKKIGQRQWEFPVTELDKRIKFFEFKINSLKNKLDIMKQIRGVKK